MEPAYPNKQMGEFSSILEKIWGIVQLLYGVPQLCVAGNCQGGKLRLLAAAVLNPQAPATSDYEGGEMKTTKRLGSQQTTSAETISETS